MKERKMMHNMIDYWGENNGKKNDRTIPGTLARSYVYEYPR